MTVWFLTLLHFLVINEEWSEENLEGSSFICSSPSLSVFIAFWGVPISACIGLLLLYFFSYFCVFFLPFFSPFTISNVLMSLVQVPTAPGASDFINVSIL